MESLVKNGYCAYCKTEVPAALSSGPHLKTQARYCPNCGKQIWTKCECGTNLRYEDRFCQNCEKPNPIYLGDDPEYYADTIEK